MDDIDTHNIELQLLLQAIHLKYGYDFKNYAKASIKRRILQRMEKDNLHSISEMQHKILYDVDFFEHLLLELSLHVAEMFRDPPIYLRLRQKIIPELKKFAHLKIWHVGCSTGEEVYSMAILLKEEGLYERSQIYATDMNKQLLKQAREGIYSIKKLRQYTANYQKAGGLESFSDYYSAHYDHVVMNKSLKEHILFSDHNLATDGVFGEMNLIMARNVLIYFNRELQNRALGLFSDSLSPSGFLCLGLKESIMLAGCAKYFEEVYKDQKIYRKF
jgi:chemotaxis protein methyltransferase CheR